MNKPDPSILQLYGIEFHIHRKSRRKNLSIQIIPHEAVKVLVNKTTPLKEIERFLLDKQRWVVTNVERSLQFPKPLRSTYLPNTSELYLGTRHAVQHVPTPLKKAFVSTHSETLFFHIPETHWSQREKLDRAVFEKLFLIYLRRQAELFFTERIQHHSSIMNLSPQKVTLRGQKSRWGSCTSQGSISLNWKLMRAPAWVIDAVIVHELAHLQHLNHSKDFWTLVNTYAPDHQKADLWLRQNLTAR